MLQGMGTSEWWFRVGDVEGPPGCHRCRSRGASPRRSGRFLRPVEVAGHQAGGPLARCGRHRFRAPVAAAAHFAEGHRSGGSRVDREPARRPRRLGPRRRAPHHCLAPPGPSRNRCVALDDPPPPRGRRPRRPEPRKAAQKLLCPVRSRSAQRVLAIGFHPLAPRRRRHNRGHHLAGRPFAPRALRHRPPPRHRAHRGRHLQQNRLPTGTTRVGAHR